ncbi:MAG: hypothetical protein OXC95_14645 [Dehalococcoidia bacterium]|nr:hypothetical protein [Dehalococcoidia bacterium]
MGIRSLIPRHVARHPVIFLAFILVATVMSVVVSLWMVSLRGADSPRATNLSTGTAAPGAVNVPGPRTGPILVPGPPSVPAPDYFSTTWQTDKRQIAPGETIAITISMASVWDERIDFTNFPPVTALTLLYMEDGDEQVQVGLEWSGVASGVLEPDEEIIAIAPITSDMSAGLQPGRYYGFLDGVSIIAGPADPENHRTVLGFSSAILFVVTPPEGALDKTLTLKQMRETNGVTLTLERIDFSPEQTTIIILDSPLSEIYGQSPYVPSVRHASSTVTQAVEPRILAPLPAPLAVGQRPDLNARYRVDGGPWEELNRPGYGATPEGKGIRYRWTLGPVSSNAGTFVFEIDAITHPESGTSSLWEWVVLLR